MFLRKQIQLLKKIVYYCCLKKISGTLHELVYLKLFETIFVRGIDPANQGQDRRSFRVSN